MWKEYLAAFGIKVDDAALGVFSGKIDALKKNLSGFATVAAGAFVVKGAVDLTREVAELGDEIGDTATKLEVGTDALQEWRYVMQTAGTEAETFDASIRKMNLTSAQAASGAKEVADAYADVGVELFDGNKQLRASEDLFEDTILNLSQMTDTAKRNAAASKIFGKNYSEILGVLDKGADGIAAVRKEFRESGGMFSAEALAQAGEYDEAMIRFDATLRGLKISIASILMPALTWLTVKGGQVVQFFTKLNKTTNFLKTGLVIFGAVAVKALFALAVAARATLVSFAPFALQAIVFAGIALIVEDLITLFTGGESSIRDFVDAMFGKGTTDRIVEDVKEIYAEVSKLIKGMIEWLPKVDARWLALIAVLVPFKNLIMFLATTALRLLANSALVLGRALMWAGASASAAWLPWIALAAVIVGSILGIIYVVKNWERISSDFAYFWQNAIVPIFTGAFAAIGSAWDTVWNGVRSTFDRVYNYVSGKIDQLLSWGGKVASFFGFGGDTPAPSALPTVSGPQAAGGVGRSEVTNNVPIELVVNQTISGAGSPETVAGRANRGVTAAAKEGATRATLAALVPVR